MIRLSTLLATVLLLAASAPALAQSPQELRQENERLRARIDDLERELSAAQQEINRLRAELASTIAGTAGGVAPPLPEPEVTIDESKPHASPRALFNALATSYAEATAQADAAVEIGSRLHLRGLQRWATRLERELRQPVVWHVRSLESARAVRGGWVLRLQAVDPVSGTALGDPFDALLAQSLIGRLKALEDRGGLPDVLVLRGTMHPEVVINPDRAEPGPFDNPRLIGPYAEFGLSVTAKSLAAPAEDAAEAAQSTGG